MKKIQPVKSNEWLRPCKRNFLMSCCDCGLVHWADFDTDDDGKPIFRMRRADGYTRRERKKRNITVV